MNLKKPLVFIIFISLFACSDIYSQINNYDNSICWEIRNPKTAQPSYILGSFHILDTTKVDFPVQKVKELIDQCGNYCMEINISTIDSSQMKTIVGNCFMSDLKLNFRDSLGSESYKKLIQIADSSKGILKTLKPYLSIIKPEFIGLYVAIDKLSGKSLFFSQCNFGMDSFFEQYAISKKYRIHGLESFQEQMDMILGHTYNESILALRSCINDYYSGDSIDLFKNYVNQDLKFFKDSGFLDSTMIKRNKVMADGIDLLLQQKSVFVVIGAGHLPSKVGVLNLLAQRGYLISPYHLDLGIKRKE